MTHPAIEEILNGVDVTGLPPDLLAEIDELARLEEENPLAVYWAGGMSKGQREFHESLDRPNRLLRAANKVGKSYGLGAECWSFLLGTHPHNDVWGVATTKCSVLYVVNDLESSYADDVCRVLRELEPPGILHTDCTYDEVRGYMVRGRRGILTRDGAQVIFRSGRQDGTSLEGIWADVVIINEPPRRVRWGGIIRAAALKQAPILMAFTAVGEDLTWLEEIIEQDPVTSVLWSQTVLELNYENVPWRTKEDVDAQIANVASWERDQRIYAAWRGVTTGRAYDAFDRRNISDELPTEDVTIVLGFDHGEKARHEAVILIARWKDKRTNRHHAYLLDEYISPGATTPETDARAVERMLARHRISLLAVKEARGDINTGGKSSGGKSLNRLFESAFADLLETRQAPFRILSPRKTKGSVMTGTKAINFAFADGRYRIHPRCTESIKAYSHWRGTDSGQDKDYTHVLDAARYILGDFLDPTRTAPTKRVEIW